LNETWRRRQVSLNALATTAACAQESNDGPNQSGASVSALQMILAICVLKTQMVLLGETRMPASEPEAAF